MKYLLILSALLVLNCATPSKQPRNVIGDPPVTDKPVIVEEAPLEEAKTVALESAVEANFRVNTTPFIAYVAQNGTKNGRVIISTENPSIAHLSIPESFGADLATVRFKEFDRDLLLVKTIYKDPIFRKYYLYVLNENEWKPVTDGFILHESNVSKDFIPIEINANNPNEMIRKYSVFDLDPESKTKYTWIMKSESVPIVNR